MDFLSILFFRFHVHAPFIVHRREFSLSTSVPYIFSSFRHLLRVRPMSPEQSDRRSTSGISWDNQTELPRRRLGRYTARSVDAVELKFRPCVFLAGFSDVSG